MPVVLLTLLSIVQALALELLWDYVRTQGYLYQPGWDAVLGWTQISATFLGILLIWLIYSSSVMRFRWVPATVDSIFPFLIGIIEFTLIEMLGVAHIGVWFLVMALIFATMTWVGQVTFRAARRDEENEEFFRKLQPARWRDFLPTALNVGFQVISGVLLLVSGHTGGFAFAALLVVISAMLYQIYQTDYYWRLSVGPT
jgi:hypothetical protein